MTKRFGLILCFLSPTLHATKLICRTQDPQAPQWQIEIETSPQSSRARLTSGSEAPVDIEITESTSHSEISFSGTEFSLSLDSTDSVPRFNPFPPPAVAWAATVRSLPNCAHQLTGGSLKMACVEIRQPI